MNEEQIKVEKIGEKYERDEILKKLRDIYNGISEVPETL